MAQQILREKQGELVDKLLKLTEPIREGEKCPLCGKGMPRDENIIVRALAEGLDRGGTPRVTQVENIEKPDIAWMEYLSDAQIETLGRWIDEARERMPINEPPVEQDQETVN
jgi:DNA repair exonuclease SbcCD ATPase subunit